MNKIILISVILITLFSCTKEFKIKVDDEVKIVANSIFKQGEIIEVDILESLKTTGEIDIKELSTATVELYENGIFVENLGYSKLPSDVIGKFRSTLIPTTGNNYSIKINHPVLGKASSSNSILPTNVVVSSESAYWSTWGENNQTSVRYHFSFIIEDPTPDDYYFLTISVPILKWDEMSETYEYFAEQYTQIASGDIPKAIPYVQNGFIFNDDLFNGSNYKISGTATTYVNPFGDFLTNDVYAEDLKKDTTKLNINLYHLSNEAYNYYSSHATQLKNENDIYSEPSLVYSNIEGGVGIFAGMNVTKTSVEIVY